MTEKSKTASKKKAKKKGDSRTVAHRNRALRQEELRALCAEKVRLSKVIENIEKIENLDVKLDPTLVNRIKIANDQRLKLINKYLPDLKSIALTGDPEQPIVIAASAREMEPDEAKRAYLNAMQGEEE